MLSVQQIFLHLEERFVFLFKSVEKDNFPNIIIWHWVAVLNNNVVQDFITSWRILVLLPPQICCHRVCVSVSVCLYLCVCLGYNFWMSWHRNFIWVWYYILTISRSSSSIKVIGSWSRLHIWKHWYGYLDISFIWFYRSEVKVRSRSRSSQGQNQIVSVLLSIGKREVGLPLGGILFGFAIDYKQQRKKIHFVDNSHYHFFLNTVRLSDGISNTIPKGGYFPDLACSIKL